MTAPPRIPELFVSPAAAQGLRADAERMAAWDLTPDQIAGLVLLVGGGCLPLRGYLTEADHASVLARMRLASGALWPLPLALAVSAQFAADVAPGEDLALRAEGGLLAILSLTDKWQGPDAVLLGGRVKALPQADARLSPNALRARHLGAARVLAEPVPDGLILRPDGFEAVLLPLPRCDGPRGLLWRALVARNHGATHLVLDPMAEGRALLDRHLPEIGIDLLAPSASLGISREPDRPAGNG